MLLCVYKVHYYVFYFVSCFVLYVATQLLYPVLMLCCDYNKNINLLIIKWLKDNQTREPENVI